MIVAQVKLDQTLDFQGGSQGNEKFHLFEAFYPAGTYLIQIEVNNSPKQKPKFVIDAYGEDAVEFETIDSYIQDYLILQSGIIRSYCRKVPRKPIVEEKDFALEGSKEIRRFFGEVCGIVFLYYVNFSDNYEMVESISVKPEKKLIICSTFKGFFLFFYYLLYFNGKIVRQLILSYRYRKKLW